MTETQDNRSAMRKTIVARIATFDTSIPNPTPEQVAETIRLLDSALEVFKGTPDGNVLQKMRDELGRSRTVTKETTAAEPAMNVPVREPGEAAAGDTRLAQSAAKGGDIGAPAAAKAAKERAAMISASTADYIANTPVDEFPDYSRGGERRATIAKIIDALSELESRNNPQAVGDKGKAVGLLQSWPVSVEEANRIIGRQEHPLWTDADRLNPQQARAMAKVTLTYHYNRGVTDPVKLGGKWRDPYGKVAAEERRLGKRDQEVYEANLRKLLAGEKLD